MSEHNQAIDWSVAAIREDGSLLLSCSPDAQTALMSVQSIARGRIYVVLRTADEDFPRSRFVRIVGVGKKEELMLSLVDDQLLVHFHGADVPLNKVNEIFQVKVGDRFSQFTIAEKMEKDFSSSSLIQIPEDRSQNTQA